MCEGFTKGPWDMSKHKTTNPNQWQIKQHEFSEYPYEGDLVEEWGVYPPLGESGPVALVAGEKNARLIVTAVNAHYELLEALKEARQQIEYLHEKFKETGTGNTVLSRIDSVIQKIEGK